MTFEEFLAACGSARSVLTTDGTALLIGDYVIECQGLDSSITSYIADALRLIPTETPEPPAPDNSELIALIDKMITERMAEIAVAPNA